MGHDQDETEIYSCVKYDHITEISLFAIVISSVMAIIIENLFSHWIQGLVALVRLMTYVPGF